MKKGNNAISLIMKGRQSIQAIKKGLITVYEAFKELIKNGIPPLTLTKCKGTDLVDYKLYGESVQESENLFNKDNMLSGFLPQSGAYPTINSSYPDACYQIIDMKAGQTFNITYTGSDATNGRIRCIDNDTNEVVGPITVAASDYYISTTSYFNGFLDGSITAKKDFKLGVLFIHSLPDNFNLQIKATVPTLETPIEVESFGDKTENLFNIKAVVRTQGNATYEFIENGIKVKAENAGSYQQVYFDYIPCAAGEYVYLSFEAEEYSEGSTNIVVRFYDENKTQKSMSNNSSSRSIKIPDGIRFLAISLNVNSKSSSIASNSYVIYRNIMIVKGSTAPKDYEPYGYKIPVTARGKNLWHTENVTYPYTVSGVTVTYDKDTQIYTFNGTTTSAADIYTIPSTTEILNIKQNETYCMRVYHIGGTTTGEPTNLRAGINDKNWTGGILCGINNPIIKFFSQDTIITRMYFYLSGQGIKYDNYQLKVQLEKGNTATDYEPYVEPITTNIYLDEPLRKIGEYVDYIDFKTKQVIRNIRNIKLNISDMNNTEEFAGWRNQEILMGDYPNENTSINTITSVMCNITNEKFVGINTKSEGIIFLNQSRWGLTQTEWKTNYPNLVFDLYYGLKTEDPQPIELPNIPTHKGTTILSVDSKINSSYMEVVYEGMGDLELLNVEDNLILNSILATDTETELNITNTEINEILDEIIGG